MIRRRTALGLAVALLAVGCSQAASPFATTSTEATTTAATTTEATTTSAATTTEATTTTAATTTTTSTTTTTTSTTTTTTAPVACPGTGVEPAPGATDISFQTAMLDGDALPDVFSAYQTGGTWHLHAILGTGYGADLALDAAWLAAHYPSGLNMVQVTASKTLGDPRQVVAVRLYAGLGQAYGLFALESCQIVPLTLASGMLPDLWQATGAAHSDFPVCGPGATVLQVVFGLTAGCSELNSCPNPEVTITEYQVTRNPARTTLVSDTNRASTHAEWVDLNARSCLNP
jgi:hypothetical protein